MIRRLHSSTASRFLVLWLTFAAAAAAKTVKLAWDAVDDDIRTYRLYWGTQSGYYSYFVDVGDTTFSTLVLPQDSVRYYIAVTAVDYWGNESAFSNEVSTSGRDVAVAGYELPTTSPNPFTHQTVVTFAVPENVRVKLTLYDALGRRVRILEEGFFEAGIHRSLWDGRDDNGVLLPAGVYMCVLAVGPRRLCRPITLIR